jgi:tetratricopeptide (TPR) repeat protein
MASKFKLEMRSEIAKGKRNWESVIAINKRIISIDKENPFAYYEIALAYEQINNTEASLEYAKSAFEINPKYFFTIQLLTRLYSTLNDNKKTYEFAKLSLANMPEEVSPPSKNIIKILRLFSMIPIMDKIHKQLSKERANWGNWRNEWVEWATKYMIWYENSKSSTS